ncbi:MAG: hypothetical protein ACSLE1_21115 [Sphingobium sp.]
MNRLIDDTAFEEAVAAIALEKRCAPSAVSRYAIARYLGVSKGGGFYTKIDAWLERKPRHAEATGDITHALLKDTGDFCDRLREQLHDHILSQARLMARDIAEPRIAAAERNAASVAHERDSAQQACITLLHVCGELGAQLHAALRTVEELRQDVGEAHARELYLADQLQDAHVTAELKVRFYRNKRAMAMRAAAQTLASALRSNRRR